MKKIFIITVVLCSLSCCFAQDKQNPEQQEIRLDSGVNYKEYKITKPNFNNKTDLYNNDDDDKDIPFDFVSSPLQLLKQYQQGNY